MFDGLKEKLGQFTADVEADIDAVDESDPEDNDGAREEKPESVNRESSDIETGEAVQISPEATDDETGADENSAHRDTGERDGGESDEAGTGEVERDTPSRGMAERAKIFASGKSVIDESDLEDHLDRLELALLSSDVEMGVTSELLDGVEANLVGETRRRLSSTGNLARDALRESLYDLISVGQFDFEKRIESTEKPVVIIFTGVNGVGKTTTIAKLSHVLEQAGHSTVLANGDTYRAGANEQLQSHADTLGRTLISHEQGSDPAAVIYDAVEYADANDVDVVLGDTAGRLHTSDDLMAQLEKIDRVVGPDMTIFVDEAVAGQDAVNRAREFDDAATIDGTILTMVDADSQGGAAISVSYVTGKPILFLGTGQEYDDLEPFDPETIVDRLMGTDE